MDIFEKASKAKLRFTYSKGILSVEDLWELKLTDLDTIAKAVSKKLREESEESFIGKKTRANTELTLQLDVLKQVIAVKLAEEEKAKARAEKSSQVEFLQDLLKKKKLNELEAMPAEEIEKQLLALKDDNA